MSDRPPALVRLDAAQRALATASLGAALAARYVGSEARWGVTAGPLCSSRAVADAWTRVLPGVPVPGPLDAAEAWARGAPPPGTTLAGAAAAAAWQALAGSAPPAATDLFIWPRDVDGSGAKAFGVAGYETMMRRAALLPPAKRNDYELSTDICGAIVFDLDARHATPELAARTEPEIAAALERAVAVAAPALGLQAADLRQTFLSSSSAGARKTSLHAVVRLPRGTAVSIETAHDWVLDHVIAAARAEPVLCYTLYVAQTRGAMYGIAAGKRILLYTREPDADGYVIAAVSRENGYFARVALADVDLDANDEVVVKCIIDDSVYHWHAYMRFVGRSKREDDPAKPPRPLRVVGTRADGTWGALDCAANTDPGDPDENPAAFFEHALAVAALLGQACERPEDGSAQRMLVLPAAPPGHIPASRKRKAAPAAEQPAPAAPPAASADPAYVHELAALRGAVDALSDERADAYESWNAVKLALRNSDDVLADADRFALFDRFSARSAKYNAAAVRRAWAAERGGGALTTASIFFWAREDSGYVPPRRPRAAPEVAVAAPPVAVEVEEPPEPPVMAAAPVAAKPAPPAARKRPAPTTVRGGKRAGAPKRARLAGAATGVVPVADVLATPAGRMRVCRLVEQCTGVACTPGDVVVPAEPGAHSTLTFAPGGACPACGAANAAGHGAAAHVHASSAVEVVCSAAPARYAGLACDVGLGSTVVYLNRPFLIDGWDPAADATANCARPEVRASLDRFFGDGVVRAEPDGAHVKLTIARTLLGRSPTGSGKTVALIALISELRRTAAPGARVRIVYLTSRQSQAIDAAARMRGLGAVCYLDAGADLRAADFVVIQVDSLPRLLEPEDDGGPGERVPHTTLLILDEVTTTLTYMKSSTLARRRPLVWYTQRAFVEEAEYVVALCADADQRARAYLEATRGAAGMRIVQNHARADAANGRVTWIYYENDAGAWMLELRVRVAAGQKVAVPSSSKERVLHVERYLRDEVAAGRLPIGQGLSGAPHPPLRILAYHSDIDDALKRQVADCTELWTHYDVVLWSPTIGAGVDFNPPLAHFDCVFAYGAVASSCVRDFVQQIARARRTRLREVHVVVVGERGAAQHWAGKIAEAVPDAYGVRSADRADIAAALAHDVAFRRAQPGATGMTRVAHIVGTDGVPRIVESFDDPVYVAQLVEDIAEEMESRAGFGPLLHRTVERRGAVWTTRGAWRAAATPDGAAAATDVDDATLAVVAARLERLEAALRAALADDTEGHAKSFVTTFVDNSRLVDMASSAMAARNARADHIAAARPLDEAGLAAATRVVRTSMASDADKAALERHHILAMLHLPFVTVLVYDFCLRFIGIAARTRFFNARGHCEPDAQAAHATNDAQSADVSDFECMVHNDAVAELEARTFVALAGWTDERGEGWIFSLDALESAEMKLRLDALPAERHAWMRAHWSSVCRANGLKSATPKGADAVTPKQLMGLVVALLRERYGLSVTKTSRKAPAALREQLSRKYGDVVKKGKTSKLYEIVQPQQHLLLELMYVRLWHLSAGGKWDDRLSAGERRVVGLVESRVPHVPFSLLEMHRVAPPSGVIVPPPAHDAHLVDLKTIAKANALMDRCVRELRKHIDAH